MDLLASLHFSLSITGPICLVLVLGIWLKWLGLASTALSSPLPSGVPGHPASLLFLSMVRTDFSTMPEPWLILYGLLGTPAGFLVLEVLAARFIRRAETAGGIFVQGSFRGNMGIMGLAYARTPMAPRG